MERVRREGNKLVVEKVFYGDWEAGKQRINKLLNILGFSEDSRIEKAVLKAEFYIKEIDFRKYGIEVVE